MSRRVARGLLTSGAVAGDSGQPLCDQDVDAGALPFEVRVDGTRVSLVDTSHVMLNKPRGYVTALTDIGHPVAHSLLAGAPLFRELRPVGRLDLDTTGLLLWTTDGRRLSLLTHPRRGVPREYHVALAQPFAPLPPGLVLRDGHAPSVQALTTLDVDAAHPSLDRSGADACYAAITIVGGAYHEVRRIFAALGSHVLALCRVRFGQLRLPPDLPLGDFRLTSFDGIG